MDHGPPLASVPVSFFDRRSGVSALAIQHLRRDGRSALVYHDARGPAEAAPLLGGIAQALLDEMGAGQRLAMIETSMPEHPAEAFVYAEVALWHPPSPAPVNASSARILTREAVALACGIQARELERTEELVSAVHVPRSCAWAGFRQLGLGRGVRRLVVAA